MNWLLDTDVISQPAKTNGNKQVHLWLQEEQTRCYTSAIVIAQLAYWVRTKRGNQRETLQKWFSRLIDSMQGRIIGFNVSVACVWAEQESFLSELGRPMPVEDSYIAATARKYQMTVVTGNEKDFQRPGLRVFNPFKLPDESDAEQNGREF